MKLGLETGKKARIEMLPLIDIVFLLLVFFIYAMLSMAVHRALPVALPASETARINKQMVVSVTVDRRGAVHVDKAPVPLRSLARVLREKTAGSKTPGVLLFADRDLSYQELFRVLDQITLSGISRVSLQAEVERER